MKVIYIIKFCKKSNKPWILSTPSHLARCQSWIRQNNSIRWDPTCGRTFYGTTYSTSALAWEKILTLKDYDKGTNVFNPFNILINHKNVSSNYLLLFNF